MKRIIFVFTVLILSLFYISNNKSDTKEYIQVSLQKEKKYNQHNLNDIKIGDYKDKVLAILGNPDRIDNSEYNFNWYVYNKDYNNFIMIGIFNDKVEGIYSNSINSSELKNIKIGDTKEDVLKKYTPIEYKKKGNTKYIINSNGEYSIIQQNNKYITFFYDKYNKDKICSYQIISKDLELETSSIYAKSNKDLIKSYEMQIIDLTNSVRVKEGLDPLKYSEKATISSKKHSKDMYINDYFDHINKNNKTPFDRMKNEGIKYLSAGENIAAGQTSAIYAHEAWMNSSGHRKNILGDYKYIGVGVEFGGTYKIYYTQNFYS